jgi:RsiW-degrading membrane proteinase PrsW (M82 family)
VAAPQGIAVAAALPAETPPRWGVQTSFIQRRQAAFWLFAVLLAVTALTNVAQQVEILQAFPTAWFVSWLLLAFWVVPVILAIYLLDQFEREPISILVAAFLWGAVVSTGLGIITNTAWFEILFKLFGGEFVQTWGPAFIGPPVEETLKYLGLVLIYLVARNEIDDLFDGFIYGAMVGLGFATVENVGYFVMPVAAGGGGDQIGPVIQMYLLRVVFSGFYMHVLWTGLTGIGLAYYVTRRDQPHSRRVLVAAGMFAAGVLAHFVWNSPLFSQILADPGPMQMLTFGILKGLPFLVFLGILIVLAQRRERRWFEVATASEVAPDVITAEEVATLGDLRRRIGARRAMSRTHGPAAGKLLGRLQRAQIDLAMVRTRVGEAAHPELIRQRELIRTLRAELAAVPALPAMPVAVASPVATPAPLAMPAEPTVPQGGAAAVPVPPPPIAEAWTPTHRVPAAGQTAWPVPDPRFPPVAVLAAGVELRLVEQTGDWARVVASNGWTGWVDARLLVLIVR